MKYLIIKITLLTSIFAQGFITDVKTYDNGQISQISYHKKLGSSIERVKVEKYFKNGQKKYEHNYRNNTRNGKWTHWYDDGTIDCTAMYKEGDLIKEWNFYDRDGNIKQRVISPESFYANSEYYIGYSRGVYSGPIQEMNEIWDEHTGQWTDKKYLSGKGNYIYGEKDDLWTYFDQDGDITEQGYYSNGNKEGKWTVFYKSGLVKREGLYKYLKRNDRWSSYKVGLWEYNYEDGTTESMRRYSDNGKKDGITTYFNQDGTIKETIEWYNGRLVRNSEIEMK